MGKRYTAEERAEALKLVDEIGGAAAARRLGIHRATLFPRFNAAIKTSVNIQRSCIFSCVHPF